MPLSSLGDYGDLNSLSQDLLTLSTFDIDLQPVGASRHKYSMADLSRRL